MPTLTPVLERMTEIAVPSPPWPITSQVTGWLRVGSAMTVEEVGMALCSLAFESSGDAVPDTVDAALDVLTDDYPLMGAGGLLLHDFDIGVAVEPGCCCDLARWRDWLNVLDRVPIDLGHGVESAPWIVYRDKVARVLISEAEPDLGGIDLAYDDVLGMLGSAQHELRCFLAGVRQWAEMVAPRRVDELVAAIDEGLSINAPLA